MSEPLYIQLHIGLGDMLITNGLVRVLNKTFPEIVLPSWAHNIETIRFMFRDLPGIKVEPVDYDGISIFGNNKRVLKLGYYSGDKFDKTIFDQEFYRQAGVPFEERWNSFHVDVSILSKTLYLPENAYAFVHDDHQRGYKINDDWIVLADQLTPSQSRNFFDHIQWLERASEVHCIDSSFLCLWDSLPHVEGQKLFLHSYARDSIAPTLKKNWVVLK